jgi:transcriptional regulator with XRE-family HTH domain
MNSQETLGRMLQRLRTAAGLTQSQVATSAGVPLSSLQNWEIDRREPAFRAAVALARALGVSAETLADTLPAEQVGRVARAAGPTKRPEPTAANPSQAQNAAAPPGPSKPRGRPKWGAD